MDVQWTLLKNFTCKKFIRTILSFTFTNMSTI